MLQAEFVTPRNVNDVLFPRDIDPNQNSSFGSAEGILSREFLIARGASGEGGKGQRREWEV